MSTNVSEEKECWQISVITLQLLLAFTDSLKLCIKRIKIEIETIEQNLDIIQQKFDIMAANHS